MGQKNVSNFDNIYDQQVEIEFQKNKMLGDYSFAFGASKLFNNKEVFYQKLEADLFLLLYWTTTSIDLIGALHEQT